MFTSEQIDHYRREGYVVYPGFVLKEGLTNLKTEIERISEGQTLANHDSSRMEMEPNQGPDGKLVRRIYEPCTYYGAFRAFSESTSLLDCVEQLFGPNLVFHYSKINMKPQNIGSVVEWHQDLSYYPLTNRDSVSILFYLDDTSEENGCLKVIPRRHASPLMSHSTEGVFRGKVTEAVDDAEAVLLSEIDRLQNDGISAAELRKAQKQTQAAFAYSTERVTEQAFWLAQSFILGDVHWFDNYAERLLAVSAADVLDVAQRYLRPKSRIVGILQPTDPQAEAE